MLNNLLNMERTNYVPMRAIKGERIPYYVLTINGIKESADISIGEYIIEYGTSHVYEVKHISMYKEPSPIYKITYNDGRYMLLKLDDLLFMGHHVGSDKLVQIISDHRNYREGVIDQYEYHFPRQSVPIFPDPYITGILIMYGDFKSKFINVPSDLTFIHELFKNRYGLEVIPDSTKNVKFRYEGDGLNTIITWEDFFQMHDKFYPIHKLISDEVIPMTYMYGSTSVRKQFIQGVFDAGFDPHIFTDSIGILNKSKLRLLEFQRMLWSMGICSIINEHDGMYKLEVLGNDYKTYASLFYDAGYIRTILSRSRKNIRAVEFPFELIIESIENVMSEGYMIDIETTKKNMIMVTDNYLPRYSILDETFSMYDQFI